MTFRIIHHGFLRLGMMFVMGTAWGPVAVVAAQTLVRYGFDPNFPPFTQVGKTGGFSGIDRDILTEVEKQLPDYRFELVPTRDWSEAYHLAQEGKIDLLLGTAQTEERSRQFAFTEPYASFPLAIIIRDSDPYRMGLSSLDGLTVAMPRDYAPADHMEKMNPKMRTLRTADMLEALRLVSNGKADATAGSLPVCTHFIRQDGLTNLKIGGFTTLRFDLRYAVRLPRAELVPALNQALAGLGERNTTAIFDTWINAPISPGVPYHVILPALGLVLAAACLAFGWFHFRNRLLAVELARRAAIERDLLAAKETAVREREEKARLLEIAAHDLKSPLAVIVMRIQHVEATHPDLPPTVHKAFQSLANTAHHMLEIVQNILSANALDQGLSLRISPVEVAPLLQRLAELHGPAGEAKNITLETASAPDGLRVMASAEALAEVLDNLVSNAIKFTSKGGRVSFSVQSLGESRLRFTVRDNGPGLSDEDQTRLYRRNVRLTPLPTGGERSHGLGLSIAHDLALLMGGRMTCESTLGQGTAFHLDLPLAG